jgi:hypothetical protein
VNGERIRRNRRYAQISFPGKPGSLALPLLSTVNRQNEYLTKNLLLQFQSAEAISCATQHKYPKVNEEMLGPFLTS